MSVNHDPSSGSTDSFEALKDWGKEFDTEQEALDFVEGRIKSGSEDRITILREFVKA